MKKHEHEKVHVQVPVYVNVHEGRERERRPGAGTGSVQRGLRAMMGACGQRAVLGFNLDKLVRGLAERDGRTLVG